jgi:hypothetical protein
VLISLSGIFVFRVVCAVQISSESFYYMFFWDCGSPHLQRVGLQTWNILECFPALSSFGSSRFRWGVPNNDLGRVQQILQLAALDVKILRGQRGEVLFQFRGLGPLACLGVGRADVQHFPLLQCCPVCIASVSVT